MSKISAEQKRVVQMQKKIADVHTKVIKWRKNQRQNKIMEEKLEQEEEDLKTTLDAIKGTIAILEDSNQISEEHRESLENRLGKIKT